jgi:hypothetical protein
MTAKALAVAAAVLIGAGALTGFIPVTSQGTNCGSAFVRSGDAFSRDLTLSMRGGYGTAEYTCSDLRSILRIPALILIGVGVVTLISAGAVSNREQRDKEAAREG